MSKCLPLLVQLALCTGRLQAQLNVLTLRESESILERVPDIAAAQKKGLCPIFSPAYDTPAELAFQVRSSCGADRGMLVDNYVVNRRTGDVTSWEDDRKPLASTFAKQLIAKARQRIVSAGEAKCLALEAAKGLSSWNEPDAIVSVAAFGKVNTFEGAMQFTASRSSRTRPTETGRMLTVDLGRAQVRDDETGLNIMSSGLGSLTSKLLELRNPLWLNDEDAISIALLLPDVAQNLRTGCKVEGGGAETSTRVVFAVHCAGRNVEGTTVAIDLRTGEATNLDSGKPLQSPEATSLAQERLARIMTRSTELKKEVASACGPE